MFRLDAHDGPGKAQEPEQAMGKTLQAHVSPQSPPQDFDGAGGLRSCVYDPRFSVRI